MMNINDGSVASFSNAWMNEELTLRWCDEVLGQFTFQKHLAWDSFEVHITDDIKRKLTTSKIELLSKYIQAPDLVWNKPFKAKIQAFYNDWLAHGVHEYTTVGNMKPVPQQKMRKFIKRAWKKHGKVYQKK